MTGYICFYRGRSLVSRIIKWFTWGQYSHVAYMFADGRLIEAWHKGGEKWWHGAVIERASYHEGHKPGTVIERYQIDGMTEQQEEYLIEGLRKEIGRRYDFLGIFGFIRRKNIHDFFKWFCSELVFQKVWEAGVHLLERIKASQVSPAICNTSPLLIKIDEVITRNPDEHDTKKDIPIL